MKTTIENPRIADLEKAMDAGKHIELTAQGAVIYDRKPDPTIAEHLAEIGDGHNMGVLNPVKPDGSVQPDFRNMESHQIIETCKDSAYLWAQACHQLNPMIDRDYIIGWFANAIEKSCAVRLSQSQDGSNKA